jgi:hypothetical protein
MPVAAPKLIETIVSETSVRLLFADKPDPAEATAWVEVCAPLTDLKMPGMDRPLFDPEAAAPLHAEVQLAALRYARDVIGGETQALSELVGRNR